MTLRGATLIESLLAMAILVTVIAIALNAMILPSATSNAEVRTKALMQMDVLLENTIKNASYTRSETEIDGISYTQDFTLLQNAEDLIRLEMRAERNNEVIIERSRLIYTK